jgi:hypothetical protein
MIKLEWRRGTCVENRRSALNRVISDLRRKVGSTNGWIRKRSLGYTLLITWLWHGIPRLRPWSVKRRRRKMRNHLPAWESWRSTIHLILKLVLIVGWHRDWVGDFGLLHHGVEAAPLIGDIRGLSLSRVPLSLIPPPVLSLIVSLASRRRGRGRGRGAASVRPWDWVCRPVVASVLHLARVIAFAVIPSFVPCISPFPASPSLPLSALEVGGVVEPIVVIPPAAVIRPASPVIPVVLGPRGVPPVARGARCDGAATPEAAARNATVFVVPGTELASA